MTVTGGSSDARRPDGFLVNGTVLLLLLFDTHIAIMKFSVVALLALPALTAAFAPAQPRVAFMTSMNAAAAAASKEEDLELTRKVIAQFRDGDSSEEAAAPTPEPAPEKKEE